VNGVVLVTTRAIGLFPVLPGVCNRTGLFDPRSPPHLPDVRSLVLLCDKWRNDKEIEFGTKNALMLLETDDLPTPAPLHAHSTPTPFCRGGNLVDGFRTEMRVQSTLANAYRVTGVCSSEVQREHMALWCYELRPPR
jgi:hypothetical protein